MVFKIKIYPYYHLNKINFSNINNTGYAGPSSLDDFFKRKYFLIPSGRFGIKYILEKKQLDKDDEVYISTSTESPYVTSCVTCTIFNNCKPSRVISEKTKLIFIIHEFGIPNPKTKELIKLGKKNNIEVFEDCAHTFDSKIGNEYVGTLGDYSIFSLTKIFPVSFGGILISNKINDVVLGESIKKKLENLKNELDKFISLLPYFSFKRRENFRYLKDKFTERGLKNCFNISDGITPYYFPLTLDIDVEIVFEKVIQNNIECGIWHGKNAILFPIHPLLDKNDLDYIVKTVDKVLLTE